MRSISPIHSSAPSERWLVSYSDLTTLLFALFVVLFAASRMEKRKTPMPSRPAIVRTAARSAISPVPPQARLSPARRSIEDGLKNEIAGGQASVSLQERGLVIGLNSAAFFSRGDSEVNPSAYKVVERLSAILKRIPNRLRLEGHTDSLPIRTPRFRNNWELSAARSVSMLNLMTDQFGIERGRLEVVGYADTSVESGVPDDAGYARRVDIVVLNELAPPR